MHVRVVVSGRVQGVFYRASTQREAERLGLSGWVRNLEDGRVEMVAHGASDAVRELIRWCHRGPPAAVVGQVEVEDSNEDPLDGFVVR